MSAKAAIIETEQNLNRAAYAAQKALTDPTNREQHVTAAAAHIASAVKSIKPAMPAKAEPKKAPAKKAKK